MSGLEIAALAVAVVWLSVLSFVVVLMTRQLGLITVRLSLAAPHSPADDAGPAVGARVPAEAVALIDRDEGSTVLLLLSATCGTCRSLASRLGEDEVDSHTVALVAGATPGATAIAELLPEGIDVRFDPIASRLARALNLDMVPFGIRFDSDSVSMKAFLHGPDDVRRLRDAGRTVQQQASLVAVQDGHWRSGDRERVEEVPGR